MLGNILYVTFTTVVVRTLIVTLHKGDSLRVTRLLCFMNPLLGPFECVVQDGARYYLRYSVTTYSSWCFDTGRHLQG